MILFYHHLLDLFVCACIDQSKSLKGNQTSRGRLRSAGEEKPTNLGLDTTPIGPSLPLPVALDKGEEDPTPPSRVDLREVEWGNRGVEPE